VAGPRSAEEGDRAEQEKQKPFDLGPKTGLLCIPLCGRVQTKSGFFGKKAGFSWKKRPERIGFLVKKAEYPHSGVRLRGSL